MNKQVDVIAGSVYDAAIDSTHQRFAQGKVPKLGHKVAFNDGREYIYCSTQVVLAAGNPVSVAFGGAEIANLATAAAIGATTVYVNTTGVTSGPIAAGVVAANAFSGGRLCIVDDTGEGYAYTIKSSTAGTASVGVYLTLYDPLKVAIDTTSDVVLTVNPFANVVLGIAAGKFLGVAMVPTTDASASLTKYFWVQTKGVAVGTGSGTVGQPLAVGAGVLADSAADTTNEVGTCMATSANGNVVVWLDGAGL